MIKYKHITQYIISILSIAGVAIVCYIAEDLVGYKMVALILLLVVSLLAMVIDMIPVIVAAVLSAIIWNYFFIPPVFTFHISNSEDMLMFAMYFVVALLSAVLSNRIRKAEKKARDKEEKENTIKLYNTLLNSLSHELRTPIATIVGAVDILKENNTNLTAENHVELLNQIDLASMRLNRQVENLLNMSRLETGNLQLKREWCDINELIYSTINKVEPDAKSHTIVFKEEEKLPLYKIDSGLIEQVIINILYNALVYTPSQSIITIYTQSTEEYLVIVISDNGNGIPEDKLSFLFDKFYRLPQSKTGGSGLGLSIAKGFVEAHQGKITVKNNLDKGCSFEFRIPAQTNYINNLNI